MNPKKAHAFCCCSFHTGKGGRHRLAWAASARSPRLPGGGPRWDGRAWTVGWGSGPHLPCEVLGWERPLSCAARSCAASVLCCPTLSFSVLSYCRGRRGRLGRDSLAYRAAPVTAGCGVRGPVARAVREDVAGPRALRWGVLPLPCGGTGPRPCRGATAAAVAGHGAGHGPGYFLPPASRGLPHRPPGWSLRRVPGELAAPSAGVAPPAGSGRRSAPRWPSPARSPRPAPLFGLSLSVATAFSDSSGVTDGALRLVVGGAASLLRLGSNT